jgi:Fe-S-cluster containining protein
MRKNQPPNLDKKCPFIDGPCIKSECAIYDARFGKCQIEVLVYNLYRVSEGLKQSLDS